MSSTKAGLAKQIIMSSAYWTLNKNMVQMFGLESAMLLSAFAEADSMLRDADGWFYQTTKTLEEITTLSRHKQDKYIRKLIGFGVLQQENKGMPMKRYFRIDYEVLATLLADFQQTGQTQVKEPVTEVEEEEEIEVDAENVEKCQFAKNRQPTLLKTDNQLCEKSATIKNIDKELDKESRYDDSLRSSSSMLDRPSKYRATAVVQSLDDVVAMASAKSIEARAVKEKKVRKPVQNANTATAYFASKFQETFGCVAPLELAKDRALMKKMIEHYSYDTVIVMIDWLFRNWAKFRRECNLTGVPTVGMLFGFRSYLQEQTMYLVEDTTQKAEEVGSGIWGV